jgi:hypothetical protein
MIPFALPPLLPSTPAGLSTSEVVVLTSARRLPGLLLSLSRDGRLTLWDVRSGECLASVVSDATTAVRQQQRQRQGGEADDHQ